MFYVYTVSVIILSVFTECKTVSVSPVPHGKFVHLRKQGYDYGGDVSHLKSLQLEYKGYLNPLLQQNPAFQDFHQPYPGHSPKTEDIKQDFQQQFNNLYQHQLNYHDGQFKQREPLALFVSKPEGQNFLKQQEVKPPTEKALEWESYKLDNDGGQLKQEFQPMSKKPPQIQFNKHNLQELTNNMHNQYPLYPPAKEFYPGLKLPQQPVNLYVGFEDFKQNAIQQPVEAAKQNFNAFNLPKLQQPSLYPAQQQKQEGLPESSINYHPFGGHLFELDKGRQQEQEQQKQQLHFGQQQLGQDGFKSIINQISNSMDSNKQQQHGSGEFNNLFAHITNNAGGRIHGNQGITNEFKKPNEQNILKFSNEDAVEPQEVGKVQFGKVISFNNTYDAGSASIRESKHGKGKKKRTKRLRPTREPKYTYIIRARRHKNS